MTEACQVAGEILDAEGWEAVTMRRLAEEMGIRAPSLYKHLRDKEELRAAAAYRRWALSRPHLYTLATSGVLDRSRLPEGIEDGAAQPLLEALGDQDRARAAWASAHGLAILEIDGRFPPGADVDAAWQAMVDAFNASAAR